MRFKAMTGLALAAALLSVATAARAQRIQVAVNGEPVYFSGLPPREVNGRVLVPLRGVFEMLGAYVDWDQASRTVLANRGADLQVELPIGSRYALVNGERVQLDVPAMSIAGTTMVPLRFLSETLGAVVTWRPAERLVSVQTGREVVARAHRTLTGAGIPEVQSVSHNLADLQVLPGQLVRVTMRATPGGRGFFRIRGVVGQRPMTEVAPGVYEGTWRANVPAPMTVAPEDILAFVLIGNRASAEAYP